LKPAYIGHRVRLAETPRPLELFVDELEEDLTFG
jgi:hypothetical protein